MTKPLAMLALVAAALLGAACGDEPKRPPVATDGPASPGAAGGGGGGGGASDGGAGSDGGDLDAGTCTDLEATGIVIDQLAVNEDPSPGTGGEILDGVYDVSDARFHVGATGLPGITGSSYQGAIRIEGERFERVMIFRSSAGAVSEVRSSGTLATNLTNATISLSCPNASQEQLTYTVATTSLTFSNLVTKESFTFTRRP